MGQCTTRSEAVYTVPASDSQKKRREGERRPHGKERVRLCLGADGHRSVLAELTRNLQNTKRRERAMTMGLLTDAEQAGDEPN